VRWRFGRLRVVAAAVVAIATPCARPALADARPEVAARAVLKNARADFAASNYGLGVTRLQRALEACGEGRCAPATRAALLMSLGAMQIKRGAKDEASRAFFEAAALLPDIALDPTYDSPELRGVLLAATGMKNGPPDSARTAPTGDFTHSPAAEQAVQTPLPVYLDGGPDGVVRVVLQYKPDSSSTWKSVDLEKIDQGWGGLIPCGDVTPGPLRYYIQAFDDANAPVAGNGDARHSYTVLIKDTIAGEAPHLPGKPPPASCGEPGPCPPGVPRCGKHDGAGEDHHDEEVSLPRDSTPVPKFKRFWIGAGAELEFMRLPAHNDVCAVNPATGLPSNGRNLYCTTLAGADFPDRSVTLENAGLCTAAQVASGLCPTDTGGRINQAIVRGNLRLVGSFDYAITANLLVGARFGASLFPYPGHAAVNDGRELGSRLYGEIRGTFVFGANAIGSPGFKPFVLLGGGVAPFDGHASSAAAFCPAAQPAGPGNPCQVPLFTGRVNVWQTNGPGFGTLGIGLRWVATQAFALSVAARVNLSFHQDGWEPSFTPLIPTFGPELAAQYGF
jgi:hypothetical protein